MRHSFLIALTTFLFSFSSVLAQTAPIPPENEGPPPHTTIVARQILTVMQCYHIAMPRILLDDTETVVTEKQRRGLENCAVMVSVLWGTVLHKDELPDELYEAVTNLAWGRSRLVNLLESSEDEELTLGRVATETDRYFSLAEAYTLVWIDQACADNDPACDWGLRHYARERG